MSALGVAELRVLAAELAARPGLWDWRVRHDPRRRVFEELPCGPAVSGWVIAWMPGHDTGFHDHGRSSGAVIVVRGRVREDRLGSGRTHVFGPGDVFDFAPGEVHRVRHDGEEPTVTLHVYSPRLADVGAWVPGEDGALMRTELPAGQELRAA